MFLRSGQGNFCLNGARPENKTFARVDGRKLLDKWTHLTVTYDAGAKVAIAYVDGRRRAALVWTQAPAIDLVAPFRIGGWDAADRAPDGAVDEVRIHSRALSAAEVADLAAGRHAGKGLAACWKPADVKGDRIRDASGTGHDAQIISATRARPAGPQHLTSAYYVYVRRL